MVTDEGDIAENNLRDEIPFDTPGETETKVKCLNDADPEEIYYLPTNKATSKTQKKNIKA